MAASQLVRVSLSPRQPWFRSAADAHPLAAASPRGSPRLARAQPGHRSPPASKPGLSSPGVAEIRRAGKGAWQSKLAPLLSHLRCFQVIRLLAFSPAHTCSGRAERSRVSRWGRFPEAQWRQKELQRSETASDLANCDSNGEALRVTEHPSATEA